MRTKARVLALISVMPKKQLELPEARSWAAPGRSDIMGCPSHASIIVKITPTGPLSSSWAGQGQYSSFLPHFCLRISNQVLAREEVFMEGPLEPSMGPSLADVLLCTFESTMQGLLYFLWENFCPGSNYSSPTAFSLKWNPATSGQHREVNNTR